MKKILHILLTVTILLVSAAPALGQGVIPVPVKENPTTPTPPTPTPGDGGSNSNVKTPSTPKTPVAPPAPVVKQVDTYLNADATNVSFPAKTKGAQRVINVKTDADGWYIDETPYFINVVDRNSNSFTITCDDNISGDRTGYITLLTEKNRARIAVNQGSGIGATINKLWLEVDAVRDGETGMYIHLDVDATGLNGHELRANAYFTDRNGNKLSDLDNRYGTGDGQVSTGVTATSTSDVMHWSDLAMFIPYEQFHLGTGDYTLKFNVQLFDLSENGNYLAGTKRQSFPFSRH